MYSLVNFELKFWSLLLTFSPALESIFIFLTLFIDNEERIPKWRDIWRSCLPRPPLSGLFPVAAVRFEETEFPARAMTTWIQGNPGGHHGNHLGTGGGGRRYLWSQVLLCGCGQMQSHCCILDYFRSSKHRFWFNLNVDKPVFLCWYSRWLFFFLLSTCPP